MTLLEVTGNVQNRFVQVAVLLHLLDPVRGEPAAHSLDQGTDGIERRRECLLKRKFLDSFALLCARKKDSDTVSAASIEEGLPEGTVIRIASNRGVTNATLQGLRELVNILNAVASGECSASDTETKVLTRIIGLDIVRIRHYLKELRNVNDTAREAVVGLQSKMAGSLCSQSDHSALRSFPEWFTRIFSIRDVPLDSAPDKLVGHIRWALEARQTYMACLRTAFSADRQALPRWIYAILKLGRYAVASIALLQLASEFPSLFNPMLVEPASAPRQVQFTISEGEMPLTSVLRRIVGGREAHYTSRLARVWSVVDPESYFRNACTLDLRVHAEMQLLNFYDCNPERRPAFRFIGVSKKSCFLCQQFLRSHPQPFSVSSCHQKLYLSWRPPPSPNSGVYKQYKTITTELAKSMEAAAKQELESRLGFRRPVPPDSTAGVSLSGLAYSNSERGPARSNSAVTKTDAILKEPESREPHCSTSSVQPIEVVDLTSPDEEMSWTPSNTATVSNSSVGEMVFHVMRAGDSRRQDIISLGDVVDPCSRRPSWTRLVEILRDHSGTRFTDGEVLMVNDQIRVANERQFLACLQFLRNATLLNSDVFVYPTPPDSLEQDRQVEKMSG